MDVKRVKEITRVVISAEYASQPPAQRDAIKKLEASLLQAWEAEEYAEAFTPIVMLDESAPEPEPKSKLDEIRELITSINFTPEVREVYEKLMEYLEEQEG